MAKAHNRRSSEEAAGRAIKKREVGWPDGRGEGEMWLDSVGVVVSQCSSWGGEGSF